MARPTIVITIDLDGKPTVAVEGHAGAGCEALSADIERALGKVTDNVRTSEYSARAPVQKVRQ